MSNRSFQTDVRETRTSWWRRRKRRLGYEQLPYEQLPDPTSFGPASWRMNSGLEVGYS